MSSNKLRPDNTKEERQISLPKFLLRILSWFCPEHLYEEIEGDLIQRFQRDLKPSDRFERSDEYLLRRAKIKFIWNAVRFFRPGILMRNKPFTTTIPFYMLAHYLKISSRVLWRNKSFAAINIMGLTVGMTGAVLLFLWIRNEFSYDRFHPDKERTYKAWNRATEEGKIACWDITPRILAPTLEGDYAFVEKAVSYAQWSGKYLFTAGETRVIENGRFADPEFLTMFSFPLIKGNPLNALGNPNSIVLTEKFAKQLFGDKDAFGAALTITESGYTFPFTVTGIVQNLPSNTDFSFNYLLPWSFLESVGEKGEQWGNNSVQTFVKLKPGVDVEKINQEIRNIRKEHSTEAEGGNDEVFLYPLEKMHLYAKFENGVPAGGRIEIIRVMGILGICLIAIACINFINLSTARAQKRSKEIGIRKVTGAYRTSLVFQFLCESVLLAMVAGIISFLAAYLLLPLFNTFTEQQLSFEFQHIQIWLIAFVLILVVGLLAGTYPAAYLSSFHPVRVLKGAVMSSTSRSPFRKALVVFQFGLAITLIFSTIVIRKQIEYTQNRDAGYDRNNLIYHALPGDLLKNFTAYKNELIQSGVAEFVTKTGSPITKPASNTTMVKWQGMDPQSRTLIDRFYTDDHITKTAGLTLMEGRDIDPDQFPSDSSAVLLNESAVQAMGFKNPIGEIIIDNGKEWHVVGVIKNFILNSPYESVRPLILESGEGWFSTVHIKLNKNKPTQESIALIAKLFSKYDPAYPFDFQFADESYQRKFSSLEKTLAITGFFSSLVIFIACLGLLGLSTYMIETRTKEIGLRKVLGGSVFSITKLLGYDLLKPILIAVLVFSPFAWFVMNWWLQFSQYRISLDVWLLLMAILSLMLIAFITVGTQTIKAANANPVNSLKAE